MGKYHDILGVSSSASLDEIKRVWKKLNKELHPDVTGNDQVAEERLKEINEAYQNLKNGVSDPEPTPQHRRSSWEDIERAARAHAQANADYAKRHSFTSINQTIQVPFDIMIKGGKFTAQVLTVGGSTLMTMRTTNVTIDIKPNTKVHQQYRQELNNGTVLNFIILPGSIPGFEVHNLDILTTTRMDVFDFLLRKSQTITHPSGKTYKLEIPKQSDLIRLTGLGLDDALSGKRGDLYIKVVPTFPVLDDSQINVLREAVEKIRRE